MFTGLIQAVGHVEARQPLGGDLRLVVAGGQLPMHDLQVGESIAVSGVCLTVVEFDARNFAADVSNETLSLTTLATLQAGAVVNLERSMLPTTRMGGHLVAGHVDGIGRVEDVHDDGRCQRWRFSAPQSLLRYLAVKGSVAVDGVSLTVNAVGESDFEVNLVPHTVAQTAFAQTGIGAMVNLEADVVARYVERLLECRDVGGG